MDLENFFKNIENTGSIIPKKNIPLVKMTDINSKLVGIGKIYEFPLYIGQFESRARKLVEKCFSKNDKNLYLRHGNIFVLNEALKHFSNKHLNKTFSINMNEMDYKIQFAYVLIYFSDLSNLDLKLGFKFYNDLPQERFIDLLKNSGYFYMGGKMVINDEDILESIDIFSIHYINKMNIIQDIITNVPF